MIVGRRVKLKILRKSNIEDLLNILQSNAASMLSSKYGKSLDREHLHKKFCEDIGENYKRVMHFIALSRKNEVIGYASIGNINWNNGTAEYSVLVEDRLLGLGYGHLIGRLIIKYCFEELNLVKLSYKINVQNERMITNSFNERNKKIIRKVPVNSELTVDYYYGEIHRETI